MEDKLNEFLKKKKTPAANTPLTGKDEVVVNQRDGLFERRELINPKHVTRDGRQLLREDNYRA